MVLFRLSISTVYKDKAMNENEKDNVSVPYYIHEGILSRMERGNKRLLIALIVSLIAIVLNNVVWIQYTKWQQSENTRIITEINEKE